MSPRLKNRVLAVFCAKLCRYKRRIFVLQSATKRIFADFLLQSGFWLSWRSTKFQRFRISTIYKPSRIMSKSVVAQRQKKRVCCSQCGARVQFKRMFRHIHSCKKSIRPIVWSRKKLRRVSRSRRLSTFATSKFYARTVSFAARCGADRL